MKQSRESPDASKVLCPCFSFCSSTSLFDSIKVQLFPILIVPSSLLSHVITNPQQAPSCLLYLFTISASLPNTLHHSFRGVTYQQHFLFSTLFSSPPTPFRLSPTSSIARTRIPPSIITTPLRQDIGRNGHAHRESRHCCRREQSGCSSRFSQGKRLRLCPSYVFRC
jgi:hypothetical protein